MKIKPYIKSGLDKDKELWYDMGIKLSCNSLNDVILLTSHEDIMHKIIKTVEELINTEILSHAV